MLVYVSVRALHVDITIYTNFVENDLINTFVHFI